MTKTDWGNIHINLGLLFLISLFLHIYYNWKPLISYLKNTARQLKVFTPEFNAALVIMIVFIVGTYFLVPPFNLVMSLNDHFKDTGAEKYGEPPYGHAELSSLRTFAKKMSLDLSKSMELLNKALAFQLPSQVLKNVQIAYNQIISTPHWHFENYHHILYFRLTP